MIKYNQALIVDDDPIYLMVTTEMLLAMGWSEVATAENGMDGLELVRSGRDFDLIISDLNMPNMDGASFIRELGKESFSGHAIIVSGEDPALLKSVQSMAIMSGIKLLGSLPKPLNEDGLLALLERPANLRFDTKAKSLTVSEIMDAVKSNRFVPHFQPKLHIGTGEISGVEVLARLNGLDGRIITPDQFIETAEQHGLIGMITDQMISQVVRSYADLAALIPELDIALNVSPIMLNDRSLPDRLVNQFQRAGIATKNVTIEVTENQLVVHGADSLEVLSRLRLKGFQLAIDDFGTGATSFEHLQLYPFNQLKIDKSFIQNALSDPFAEATVKTSAQLAQLLKMEIVAEGIETEAEYEFARSCGAHTVQGYYISRPLDSEHLLEFLDTRKTRSVDAA